MQNMTLVMCLATACAAAVAWSPEQSNALTLRYGLPDVLTLHEPIVLDLEVPNSAKVPITIDLGPSNVGGFEFDLVTPTGAKVSARPRTGYSREGRVGFEQLGVLEVEAGQTVKQWIVLNQWFDFSEVGTYVLTVRFTGAIQARGGSSVNANRSTVADIQVRARSEEALLRTCRTLLDAVRGPDQDRKWRAMKALTYVEDEVAIPFLLESATISPVAGSEISALVRIGGERARTALIELTKSSRGMTAQLAKAALLTIK